MTRIQIAAIAVVAAVAGTAAQAQDPQARDQQALTAERRAVELQSALASKVRVPLISKIVTGAPYSAEVVIENIQVLADGNRITSKSTGRVFRDSQGRIRREEDRAPGQVASISIIDPVASVSIGLDPESRTAWKTPTGTATAIVSKVAPGSQPDPAEMERKRAVERELAGSHAAGTLVAMPAQAPQRVMKRRSGSPEWDEKTEVLSARNIEGVMAEGRRITRTIPAGAIGNEQPIVTVTEEWMSNDLQILVMTKSSDPREGEHTYRLLNITRAEPNASWFEIPADYTVRDSGVNRLAPSMRKQ